MKSDIHNSKSQYIYCVALSLTPRGFVSSSEVCNITGGPIRSCFLAEIINPKPTNLQQTNKFTHTYSDIRSITHLQQRS